MNRRLRIGIACYPWLGGSGILGTSLAEALHGRGYTVSLISTVRPFRLKKKKIQFYAANEIPHPSFKNYIYQSSVTETIVNVVLAEKLDIIHAHYLFPFGASAIEAKNILVRRGVRVHTVLTPHGTDIVSIARDYTPTVTNYILNQADTVTVASVDLKARTDAFLAKKKAVVIQNFVDCDVIKKTQPAPRLKFAKPNEKILIHSSNFRPIKRLDDTLDVFQRISRAVPSKLLLIGDPDMLSRRRIRKRIAQDRNVILVGKRRNVFPFLKIADALLSTSAYENCSMVILEALAAGVPVLATRVGGNPEIIEHRKSGFLAPLGQSEKLAAYGIELLTHPDVHKRMGEEALYRSSRFSPTVVLPMYELLYRLITNGQRFAPNRFNLTRAIP